MIQFIQFEDFSGVTHSVNVAHIIDISHYESNSTTILLSNGNTLTTSESSSDLLHKMG